MDEIISRIDSSLLYIRDLKPSSVSVYEVERGGSNYVLKVAKASHEWGLKHIEREGEILALANDVPWITHLIQKYNLAGQSGLAILKEYFDGQSLLKSELDFISDTKVQSKLEGSVRDLHSLGIARLDLHHQNIVLSPNRDEARIIDLGYGLFSKSLSSSKFEKFKSDDFCDLETYIFK